MIPKQIVTTSKHVPWITKDIASLIRKKVSFYHQAVHSNSTCAWAKYKHARHSVVGALRSAKSDFLLSFSGSWKIPKKFCSLYTSTSGRRQLVPDTLYFNNKQAHNDFTKTDLLNSYFCSYFSQTHPSCFSLPPPFPPNTLSIYKWLYQRCFKLLIKLKANTATGPDGISSLTIRHTAPSITSYITEMFNKSLSFGYNPSEWKMSYITPICKDFDPAQACNYRPISFCPKFWKELYIMKCLLSFTLAPAYLTASLVIVQLVLHRKLFSMSHTTACPTQEALFHVSHDCMPQATW